MEKTAGAIAAVALVLIVLGWLNGWGCDQTCWNYWSARQQVQKVSVVPVIPSRPVRRQAWVPSVNCNEIGGKRTINPNTGKSSCFVPSKVTVRP